ncbi:PepSY domain-containing protein [Diaphorobacter aerolatus]|uniref:PepSY domain-containing protein n=1 Tax=Diaphorobacter aerolatus TaxID=1288495 RepID=A0A7H0GIC5_9BURK|nr:PepSY domain-containing protein [Diaphorobacter aerolatus]QNP48041.1 PepSY domain-containing protein [Diaphorobacter aerolatus]
MNIQARHKRLPRRALGAVSRFALVLALCASPGTLARIAEAGEHDHELARKALREGKVLPLRAVLEQVERDYQGQVLEVELERDDGMFLYEIKLLGTDGRLMKLEIDAATGKVLRSKQKGRH